MPRGICVPIRYLGRPGGSVGLGAPKAFPHLYYVNLCVRIYIYISWTKDPPYFHRCRAHHIIPPKSFENIPQTSQNPLKFCSNQFQTLPKGPLGDCNGPLIEKSSILTTKKVVQRRPGVPGRGKNGVKCQVMFSIFLVFFSIQFFNQFCIDSSKLRT